MEAENLNKVAVIIYMEETFLEVGPKYRMATYPQEAVKSKIKVSQRTKTKPQKIK